MCDTFVIIATSLERTDLLIDRSLTSVYGQVGIDRDKVKVLIVDDNKVPSVTSSDIATRVHDLRCVFGLKDSWLKTEVIPNSRTKHHSGTGAWNTGIFRAFHESPSSFVAILDDDDTFWPNHLKDCLGEVKRSSDIQAVFQELEWKLPDETIWNFPLTIRDLTPREFFVGNPGIQGSNMFISSSLMAAVGGFDETFKSTTDRELMIRLLRFLEGNFQEPSDAVRVINYVGVTHYCHEGLRVTTNRGIKHAGLNRFYEKFKASFSKEDYDTSLKRASILFQYQPESHGE